MDIKINLPDVVGGGYASFWHSRKRYRVLKGGRGSKKSCNTAINFIFNLIKYPLANLIVVRKTFNTHKDSTWAQLKWAARRLGVFESWKFTLNPLEAVYLPTGQKILFRGFDEPIKITSVTVDVGVLCWAWVEEAFEIEEEKDFDTLDEGIRGIMPDGLWKQITLTFNPWVNTHWTKTRFFDHTDPEAFTLTTTYKCNEWLDDQDRKKIESLAITNPNRFKVVGLGEYGMPGGCFFEEFRSDIHVIEPYDIPTWWRKFRAMDYGFDMLAVPHFAVDDKANLVIFREIYEPGLTLTNAAIKVLDFEKEGEEYAYTAASPDLWKREGQQRTGKPQGPHEVEYMIKAGLKGIIPADNDRIPGWRSVREYLKVYEEVDNQGIPFKTARLKIFNTCPNAIRTLSSVVQDEHKPEDVSDEPHELTHMPEAIRYGCMSRPQRSITDREKQARKKARKALTKPRNRITGT
jgi:phage terminase large subunit